MHQIICAALLCTLAVAASGCSPREESPVPGSEKELSFRVVDTDFSKGRLGYQQEIRLEDLVRLHGHLCDGLIEGALALQYGLPLLYPDELIDRTNTRVASRSSPCLADAALLLSGARYQYGTFFVNDDLPGLYVIGRADREEAFAIRRKSGVKPPAIDILGGQAIAGQLSPCGLDSLRQLEEDYADFLLETKALGELFAVEPLEGFSWVIPLKNDFLKTDILNKNAAACSAMIQQ
jgi:acetolactate decarboxylase